MKDDNWLNKKYIKCPSCNEELQICDHSPYEHSYRMYCNLCPKRVDIGVYNSIFEKVKNHKTLSYEELLTEFENRLQKCECGGSYKLDSKRRCLHCESPLDLNEEQNVWLAAYWKEFDNDEEEDKIEEKMNKFIIKPKWKT